MKILLLNDNPVVNKLVTLSAQKTSDELEVVTSINEISSDNYDLLVVDDNMYSESLFNDIQAKAKFSKSLYICSRDAKQVEQFSSSIKKPFLPTDLVELFSSISHDVDTIDLSQPEEDNLDIVEEELSPNIPEELELDEIKLDDNEENLELDELDLELDDDISLDTEINESVLDHEEAQKVKDLLDETSEEVEEDLELDEDDEPELELDEKDEPELELDKEEIEPELELDDEEPELELDDEEPELELDDEEPELELDEEELEPELELDEDDEPELELDNEELEPTKEELDIEEQINIAVSDLSEEDLNSEVNEETLLDIATNEIDSFDTLTSKDLKIAIGEEVEETPEEIAVETEIEETDLIADEVTKDTNNSGIEALKKLLAALTDKDVAASMKGMKISINITLGDN